MPSGIGVIDTMIGFPDQDFAVYDFIRNQLKDQESTDYEFPVEYMFKNVPKELYGIDADPIEVTLGEMDFVSVNCPKNEETTGIISKAEIEAMKPTAFLVNTARGGIIDEADLLDCMKRKVIAGAGIDPFVVEPATADEPLFQLDNFIFSPHSAGVTEESMFRMGANTAQNVVDCFDGKLDPANVINKEVL